MKKTLFVATGNKDKFTRMKRWLNDESINWINPSDLDEDLALATKISDEEEKKLGGMNERAIGKAQKAASALIKYDSELLILAMDDTGYFPFFDQYIVDLRTPPDIIQNGEVIMDSVNVRLQGAGLTNYYAELTGKVATEDLMKSEAARLGYDYLPTFKFMPVVWKFALAVAEKGKPEQARVIANWDNTQYIKEEYIAKDTPDTGYMVGKIIVNSPFDDASPRLKAETEPKKALKQLLKSR